MQVYVYLTMTENWLSHSDPEEYIAYAEGTLAFEPESRAMFARNLRRWAEYYRPFYTAMRADIARIAADNHQAVGRPIYLNRHGRPLSEFGRDDILLITDDDDWFNPIV